jgi:uncharacterized protein (TIGR02588 family)
MLLFSKLSTKATREVNWLEWVVFSVGLMLLIGTLGLLIYEAVQFDMSSPSLIVSVGEPEMRHETYIVPVSVKNEGGKTASNVEVEVTAYFSPGEEEPSSVTFQFIPRHSSEQGWVTFGRDPALADSVTAQVMGFGSP